jgi:hypothetical protein
LREEKRNPKNEEKMTTTMIEILIKFPKEAQAVIEEVCINEGISYSDYFLRLYNLAKKTPNLPIVEPISPKIFVEEDETPIHSINKKGKKK